MTTLYTYWRSSAAFRVRIALGVKQLAVTQVPVHLLKNGGEQKSADYQALNPAQLVPCLQDGELTLNQSLAIIEYLDQQYPDVPLLPKDPALQAQVRAFALDIACDIHPLNNLRVLQYLTGTLGVTEEQKLAWIHHWLHSGFAALEQRLQQTAARYCFGDTLTLADICLVPQVYNALRFNLPLEAYPTISRLYQELLATPAFYAAAPEQQADAQ